MELPALVLGAGRDPIVDRVDVAEAAAYVGARGTVIEESGHDVMLDVSWREYADEVGAFAAACGRIQVAAVP